MNLYDKNKAECISPKIIMQVGLKIPLFSKSILSTFLW